MSNPYEKTFNEPLPNCCQLGSCCKGASPSKPFPQLLERAAEGDDFARGFFSIMTPYLSHEDARRVVPDIVERTLHAARKQEEFSDSGALAFYHCRYQTEDNRCGVWEDRPQFCRDYPDTPFVVMAAGCAFEPWAKTCREKYQALKQNIADLKAFREELATSQPGAWGDTLPPLPDRLFSRDEADLAQEQRLNHLSLILSMTPIYLASPLQSYWFRPA